MTKIALKLCVHGLNRRHVLAAVSFYALAFSGIANAAAADDGANSALDDIVVTAQKRTENIQKVPIAIVSLSSLQLESSGVRNVQDLAAAVPALVVSRDNAWGKIFLRGVGTNTVSIGADASVGEYIDGVYIARPSSALQDFSDVERVEVLKGPQGTLYGRNSSGGAISIYTKRPSSVLEGNASLVVGNYSTVRVRAGVSGPLSDWARIRVSGIYSDNDGYQQNTFAAGRRQYADKIKGGRISLDLSDSSAFSALIAMDYTKSNSLLVGDKISGTAYAVSKFPVQTNAYIVNMDHCQCASLEQAGITSTLIWGMDTINLKSLTAFRKDKFAMKSEIDRTALDLFSLDITTDSKTFSQELQLSSPDDGKLTWLAGLYYFYEDARANSNTVFKNPLGNSPFGVSNNTTIPHNQTNSYAVFAQGSYHLTRQLRLTLGGRYTKEDKKFVESNVTIRPAGTTSLSQGPIEVSFKAFTPKVGIEFYADEDAMLYASVTRGFKSGGFNSIGAPQAPFAPEKVWSYAAGVKSEWLDHRLRTNFEVFYYDYTNLQVNQIQPPANGAVVTIITNAANAKVKGVDADLVAKPTSNLQLELHASYLDAKYGSYIPNRGNIAINYAGNRLTQAPKLSGSASIQYTYPLADGAELMARTEVSHQSRMFFQSDNDPVVSQGKHDLLSARIEYRARRNWTIAIFGNNLTNDTYFINGQSGGLVGIALTPGVPRTFGGQLSYHF